VFGNLESGNSKLNFFPHPAKTAVMTRHQWREQEGEETRFWRANYHGGRFELYTKAKEEDRWDKLDPPKQEDWQALRDVLWRKYQRKRLAWNLVAKVDKMLGKANEGPPE
jgi:hypothetical protein